MEQKQRLIIYNRREMSVLILLGVIVAIFAFTLGVHLGKQVGVQSGDAPVGETEAVATVPDKVPSRHQLNEQSKGVQPAVDESLNQALHEEVGRTGIKLDTPRQVDLPDRTKGEAAGGSARAKVDPKMDLQDSIPAAERAAEPGKFTLQVGSHPTMNEARVQIDAIEARGLMPVLRVADIKGKGKWYRVFLGGYSTTNEVEKAGKLFVSQGVIESFVVSHNVE